jgi:RNA polymerase sigma factor (sigma-70 family)
MQAVPRMAEIVPSEDFASAVAGDEVSFARIVAAYDDEVYRVCIAVFRDQTVAADAVQAAWSIAWRKLRSVRDPARLRPWLVSVAVNEGKKLLRQRDRGTLRGRIEEASDGHGGIDPSASIESLDLRSALERLSPDDRALLAMRYVAGFNATELAAATGASPAGTRQRLKRLLDRLRTELDDG